MHGLDALVPHIHPVDQRAARVWCAVRDRSLPVPVQLAARGMFYGARYWRSVKRAIAANPATGALDEDVPRIAEAATRTSRVDRDQLMGITLAGLTISGSIGGEAFADLPDDLALPEAALLETPTMVRQRRAKLGPEGLLGRFGIGTRQWRITVEPDPNSTYVVSHGEMLAPCSGGDHEQCLVGILAGGDPQVVIGRACEMPVVGRLSIVRLFAAA